MAHIRPFGSGRVCATSWEGKALRRCQGGVFDFGILHGRLGHGSRDPAWRDGVDPSSEVMSDNLVLEGERESVLECGLGGCVVGMHGLAVLAGRRADDADLGGHFCVPFNLSQEGSGKEETAAQVHVQGGIPLGEGHVCHGDVRTPKDSVVQDEDVHTSKGRDVFEQLEDRTLGRHVAPDDLQGITEVGQETR